MLKFILFCSLILSFAVFVSAQDGSAPKGKVKAQTQMSAKITKTIDAESANIGEDVNFILTDAVQGDGIV